MNLKYLSLFLLILLLPQVSVSVSSQVNLTPSSLEISGNIVDNFANITYTVVYDNSESAVDSLVQLSLPTPDGLYLSNVSAQMGDLVFWGKVNPIQEAISIFNETIAENKTGILVTASGRSYNFEINVGAGDILTLSGFFEGYISRYLGIYSVVLLPEHFSFPQVDFSIDISVLSSVSDVIRGVLNGITGFTRVSIPDGKQLLYDGSNLSPSNIVLTYTLSQLDFGGKIIAYNNGTDNFFNYILAPEIQTVVDRQPREFIFVIDRSGSMGSSNKMEQAKNAFIAMVETLAPQDLFNIIAFDSSIEEFVPGESVTATTQNIDDAVAWVTALGPRSSTDIDAALTEAFGMFIGDNHARVIAFLSDGEPTAGVTNEGSIRQNAIDRNTPEASIFSIAFGSGASESLMSSLAYESRGEFVQIDPSSDAIQEMGVFYQSFATPVALGYTVQYTNAFDVYPDPSTFRGAIFNGSEILQTGRFVNTLSIETTLRFSSGDVVYPSTAVIDPDAAHVERIWAHNTINDLLRQVFLNGITPDIKREITSLGVFYGIVIEGFTGLTVVVEEEPDTSPEDPNSTQSTASDSGFNDVDTNVNVPISTATEQVSEAGQVVEQHVSQDAMSPGLTIFITISAIIISTHVVRKKVIRARK